MPLRAAREQCAFCFHPNTGNGCFCDRTRLKTHAHTFHTSRCLLPCGDMYRTFFRDQVCSHPPPEHLESALRIRIADVKDRLSRYWVREVEICNVTIFFLSKLFAHLDVWSSSVRLRLCLIHFGKLRCNFDESQSRIDFAGQHVVLESCFHPSDF